MSIDWTELFGDEFGNGDERTQDALNELAWQAAEELQQQESVEGQQYGDFPWDMIRCAVCHEIGVIDSVHRSVRACPYGHGTWYLDHCWDCRTPVDSRKTARCMDNLSSRTWCPGCGWYVCPNQGCSACVR